MYHTCFKRARCVPAGTGDGATTRGRAEIMTGDSMSDGPVRWTRIDGRTLAEGELEIVTARLRLRLARVGDAQAMWPAVSDPDVPRYMSWEPHRTLSETQAFLRSLRAAMVRGANLSWSIFDDATLVGLVSIIDIRRCHRALTYEQGELAYWTSPAAQGRGIMTEAGRGVIACAFETLGLNKLTVAHVPENEASRRLIERRGFRRVGVQERHFCKHGASQDQVLY